MKKVMWQSKGPIGCEYLKLIQSPQEINAKGTVIYTDEKDAYKVMYQIDLDKNWVTKSVDVAVEGKDHTLHLRSNGMGDWWSNDTYLESMQGAIDIDISVTPFSNSLPINRFEWAVGERKSFQMLYIDVPSLELLQLKQHYTLVDEDGGKRFFQYECRNYKTTIRVDQDGLVEDYPGLFTREF
ncbi:putative glycolipid-binding domain-containing protein [Pontibacillus sp. HMF3514]|uniref:putative glycolipid-binding domain-containing protein n=1 Tax=Pontibacillus sp. HMF3514 TaxID=2692425 RepID=UPI001320222A|nr:putative glycolipid-binding domain-containing protein [Pontibacillus sp. HMF3514]QHE52722.1 hypothetical protein GS400_12080 [Pontibacillus sp. HMF3514]